MISIIIQTEVNVNETIMEFRCIREGREKGG
jgi:hypothetical protein